MAFFLVTGGAGFIGSNIVEALVARGEDARVLDDFSTGKRKNLEPFLDRIGLIEGSVVDLETCREAVAGVDYVLHHAALPSVPLSVKEPVRSNAVNAVGTLNLLTAARDAGVKRFVFAASSAAYGNLPGLPKVETMQADPLSPYAAQKLTGEMYCKLFFDLYGLETVALRYFNVFGPRQDPASEYAAVIPKFITMLLGGLSPTIFGDGEQSRDFIHVDNVVQANLLACTGPAAVAGEVFNIACDDKVSLNALAGMVLDIVGCDAPIQYADARAGDVKHSYADISKARRLLGFAPAVSFRDGLSRVIDWYRRGA